MPSIFLPDLRKFRGCCVVSNFCRCLLHLCVTMETVSVSVTSALDPGGVPKQAQCVRPSSCEIPADTTMNVPCRGRGVLTLFREPRSQHEVPNSPLNTCCCRVFQKAYIQKTYHVRAPYASAPPRRHVTAIYHNHPRAHPPTDTSLPFFAEFRPVCRPTKLATS